MVGPVRGRRSPWAASQGYTKISLHLGQQKLTTVSLLEPHTLRANAHRAQAAAAAAAAATSGHTSAEVLRAACVASKVEFVVVTRHSAEQWHARLCSAGTCYRLSEGNLTTQFIYDFFSCLAGKFLQGASKLSGKIPSPMEYRAGGNFFWNGLKINMLLSTETREILGFCVWHNAYLSTYPGPDKFHHDVNPVIRKAPGGPNIVTAFGQPDGFFGSETWVEVAVLCGVGYGKLLLSRVISACERVKTSFVVNVARGRGNGQMLGLLTNAGFRELLMTHPKSKAPWEDENGDQLLLMFRDGRLQPAELAVLLSPTRTSAG